MKKLQNISLKKYNSFGIDVNARQMFIIHDHYELNDSLEYIKANNVPWILLGGGSNVLFTDDYKGSIIKNSIKGIQVLDRTNEQVFVRVNGGEDWDNFVSFCVDNNWGGLENLSLIPGNAGASPIQNIGAYGAELKDHFYSLEAMNVKTGTIKQFKKKECKFSYRSSIFKTELKNKYVICSVVFKLDLNHKINLKYKAINDHLVQKNITSPTIKDVRQAVIDIRNSKLPDPDLLGNAGSFFKNPIISKQHYENIKKEHPNIVAYPDGNNIKLSAGWLIEQTGWKGFREGNVGVYDKQALVIVNYGNAKGIEILEFAKKIKKSVYNKFGVKLMPEVNIIES